MADPSLQDAVVRGGDEVGKVSAPLPPFIHPRIRRTTIFMGHMKNEVSIYRFSSPFLACVLLPRCVSWRKPAAKRLSIFWHSLFGRDVHAPRIVGEEDEDFRFEFGRKEGGLDFVEFLHAPVWI